MTYCFRIRLEQAPGVRLDIDEKEWPLSSVSAHGEVEVSLRSATGDPIRNSEALVVIGVGYPSEEDAAEGASMWRSTVKAAFASIGYAADFGDRAPSGVIFRHGLELLEKQIGERVLNDVHGTMIYECEPPPRFASMSVNPVVGRSSEKLRRKIEVAFETDYRLTETQELAYDLYGASFFQPYVDAAFMLLMMALETVISPAARDEDVRDHVQRLIDETKTSGLTEPEITSLIGSLTRLLNESISQAGRRLAGTLVSRQFMEKSASEFFTECYEIRSQLVHGSVPRPSRQEVGSRVGALQLFVGNILGGPLSD